MTAFMEPPYEYARSHRAAGFTDCRTYNGIKRLEENNPAAPERCRDACLERQDMGPETMFPAAFSIARERL